MKGKISSVPSVEENTLQLRFEWKNGESQHALEFRMMEHISPDEAAYRLEEFATMLRNLRPQQATYP